MKSSSSSTVAIAFGALHIGDAYLLERGGQEYVKQSLNEMYRYYRVYVAKETYDTRVPKNGTSPVWPEVDES